MLRALGAVLHLGDLEFQALAVPGSDAGSGIGKSGASGKAIEALGPLLGVEKALLEKALCSKIVVEPEVPVVPAEAANARSASA